MLFKKSKKEKEKGYRKKIFYFSKNSSIFLKLFVNRYGRKK
jgi:hypothetical protein